MFANIKTDFRKGYAFIGVFAILCVFVYIAYESARISYYNMLYSYDAILSIFDSGISENDVAVYKRRIPEELMIYMKDLSLASPVLVWVTSLFVGYGAIRLLFGNKKCGIALNKHFPFPSSYQFYYVQIGLIGTIFGFVIAFSGLDTWQGMDVEGQARVLFQALGTALWSTFTAIVLAYLVCPMLIEPTLKHFVAFHDGFQIIDSKTELEILTMQARSAAASLQDLSGSVNGLASQIDSERLSALEKRFDRLSKEIISFQAVVNQIAALETWKQDVKRTLDVMRADINEVKTGVDTFEKRLSKIKESL